MDASKGAPMSFFGKKAESKSNDEVPPAPRSGPGASKGYGIEDAIRLMRTLPVEQNVELVVRVVRNTLASTNVRLADIIKDAEAKQRVLSEHLADRHKAIAEFEKEIEARREEIRRLDAELAETTSVREHLQLA